MNKDYNRAPVERQVMPEIWPRHDPDGHGPWHPSGNMPLDYRGGAVTRTRVEVELADGTRVRHCYCLGLENIFVTIEQNEKIAGVIAWRYRL